MPAKEGQVDINDFSANQKAQNQICNFVLVHCSRDSKLFSHGTVLEEMIKLSFSLGNSKTSPLTLT